MLSESDCEIILKNYLKRDEVVFKKFELRPISEDAEGFMGHHYKLLITHETGGKLMTEHFFMKTQPIKNPDQHEITQGLGMYKREIFIYDVLLKEFGKQGFDTSFAGTSYFCIPDAALVLEDLTLNGFSITERHEDFSLEHMRCALDALAAYHACGFAYERIKTQEKGSLFQLGDYYKDDLKESFFVHHTEPDNYAMNWWRGNHKTILKLISLLEGEERFTDFENLYLNYDFGKIFAVDSVLSKTCGHGDLWSNNLMFKYENKKPVKCCLLDFQLTRYFYPSLDVILLIFCNTNAQFRKLHLDGLYKYYFERLRSNLRKYGCSVDEIHPWDDFLKSIQLVMPEALTQVIIDSCITRLPKNILSNIVNEKGNSVTDLMFHNSELVADAFKNDTIYQKRTIELVEVFYDALANK